MLHEWNFINKSRTGGRETENCRSRIGILDKLWRNQVGKICKCLNKVKACVMESRVMKIWREPFSYKELVEINLFHPLRPSPQDPFPQEANDEQK